jgi:hypothetical protein
MNNKDFISEVYNLALGYRDETTRSRDNILDLLHEQKYRPQTNVKIKLTPKQTEQLMCVCQWVIDYDTDLPNRDGPRTDAVVSNAKRLSRLVNRFATEHES